ncbi:laminarinase, partial [Flavihumibacter sp. R14]|nr:laminarinase [Flavihumibacter soli]NEU06728.1 laminarinase [Flavihumibacter soli]
RYGNMTYNIPVPQSGKYTVELHFAEINFQTSGSRVFNVNVESGQFILQNIDLYKDYGGNSAAAVIKASNVQVNDGLLTIALTNVVNNAKISGIAVF